MRDMARRHYSDADRATALAVYDSTEGSDHRLRRAARDAGVPFTTLRRWVEGRENAAPAELRTEKQEALADAFERVARRALAYAETIMDGVEPDGRLLQPSITGAAIATDKAQLLRGEATSRVETSDTDAVDRRAAGILRMVKPKAKSA